MSKLLSQGGFGCVFYPGISCRGEVNDDRTVATKVQVKNFNSDNEIIIGSLIHKQGGHDLFFSPVISSCDINVRKTSNAELAKCKIIKDYKNKYVAMDMTYVESIEFSDIIKKNHSSDIILTFIESYRYLLMALEKLNSINVVHYDIKLENIMFHDTTYTPRIIDFGISIPIDKLNKSNMKKYFYVYAPTYYVWCIDINIINFLLHETTGNLTTEDVESISYLYVSSNRSLEMYSSDFITKFLEMCVNHTKTYVGRPRDELIQELLGYSKTWDNYSLSIIYLKLIALLFPNHTHDNTFVILMSQLLLTNIHPDPTRRLSVNETMAQFSNIFFLEGNIESYLDLSKHTDSVKNDTLSLVKSDIAYLKKLKITTKR